MALFEPAFTFMMDHEDAPRAGTVTFDLGGKTRFGIAEKWHPNVPPEFWTLPPLDALHIAADIYRDEYWRPIRGFEIQAQRVASKCFDMYVNLRPQIAISIFQRALDDVGAHLECDGRFGPATLAALNQEDPDKLLPQLCQLQAEHYKAHARPQDLAGLLKRAAAIPA
jgi:lysozyme family protein